MKITYYGTAAAEGWPGLYCQCEGCKQARILKGKNLRTRSQSAINDDLLIDFPADTYLHVLSYGLDLNKIQNILVTHAHEDHFYPEDLAYRQDGYCPIREPHMLTVYGNNTVKEQYERVHGFPWNGSLPEVVAMKEIQEYTPVSIGEYIVYPMLADHNPLEKCYIYVIRDKQGKTLLYAHDTGVLREDVFAFIKEKGFYFDLVSLDCTSGKIPCERNHMGIDAAANVKARLIAQGAANDHTVFVLNHFSHNSAYLNHDEIEAEAKKHGMLAAYDSMCVEF